MRVFNKVVDFLFGTLATPAPALPEKKKRKKRKKKSAYAKRLYVNSLKNTCELAVREAARLREELAAKDLEREIEKTEKKRGRAVAANLFRAAKKEEKLVYKLSKKK